jgi:hypothetical protein
MAEVVNEQKPFLTRKELARLLGFEDQTVRGWIKRKLFPQPDARIGVRCYYSRRLAEKILSEGYQPSEANG